MTTTMMATTLVKPQSTTERQGRRNFFIQFAIFAFLFAGYLLPAAAQQITGSISGTVKDEQGALIAGAAVRATNVETGFSRSTVAGGDGVGTKIQRDHSCPHGLAVHQGYGSQYGSAVLEDHLASGDQAGRRTGRDHRRKCDQLAEGNRGLWGVDRGGGRRRVDDL